MTEIECEVCGKAFSVKPSHADRRRTCSKECDAELRSEMMAGENNPFYGEEHSEEAKEQMRGSRPSLQGENNPMYGRERSGDVKQAISEARKGVPTVQGEDHPAKQPEVRKKISESHRGKSLSEEHKKKVAEASRGRTHSEETKEKMRKAAKERWENEENRNKALRGLFDQVLAEPNNLEKHVLDIIKKHGLPFEYVGYGKLLLNGLNPDFSATDGSDKLIEVFGDYWHGDYVNHSKEMEEKQRKESLREHGYETMILWEHDIEQTDDDELAETIAGFVEVDI